MVGKELALEKRKDVTLIERRPYLAKTAKTRYSELRLSVDLMMIQFL
jgi:hypothetical protein